MSDVHLTPDSHVASLFLRKHIEEDGTLSPSNFHLRHEINEKDHSVSWLEHFGKTKDLNISCIRQSLAKIKTVRADEKLAIMNVGRIIDIVKRECLVELKVTHTPRGKIPAHSSIYGLDCENEHPIAEELIKVICCVVPAIE